MLEMFGLDHRAEEVYRAALACPDATATELAGRLGLGEDDIRSALDELAQRCLLRASWNDPGVLRPVRPDIALEAMVTREQADLTRRRQQLEEGKTAIAELVTEYAGYQNDSMGGEWGEWLDGIDAIRERIEQLTWAVKYELLSVMGERPGQGEGMELTPRLAAMLLERGADVRSLHLDSVRADEAVASYACRITNMGGQIRTCPVLPPRMLIFDRSQVMLPTNPAHTAPAAVVATARGMVAVMAAFFDQLWQTAKPFGTRKHADPDSLTEQQGRLLRLLYQGNTDDAAARKLGVSVRTVRRVTSELMQRTGARNRFQLGSRALERGWLRFDGRI
jgi:DNA-binding CsgD family transcriptional regulator/sugar-specific transcriptional regulator TrmB